MISFFYGANTWAVRAAAVAKLKDSQLDCPVSVLDLTTVEAVAELLLDLKNQTLFANPKALLVVNLFGADQLAALLAALADYQKSGANNLAVAICEFDSKAGLSKKFAKEFTALNKLAKPSQAVAEPSSKELESWASAEFARAGVRISSAVVRRLVALTGTPQSRLTAIAGQATEKLATEVAKLIAYQARPNFPGENLGGRSVTSEELDLLIKTELPLNHFALIDAVAERNTRQAVDLWHQYLNQGEDPYAFLGLLVYQFRNLLQVKTLSDQGVSTANLAQSIKLHPFVLRKTEQQARGFTLEALVAIYQQLGATELAAKTGQVDLIPAISRLILEIAH